MEEYWLNALHASHKNQITGIYIWYFKEARQGPEGMIALPVTMTVWMFCFQHGIHGHRQSHRRSHPGTGFTYSIHTEEMECVAMSIYVDENNVDMLVSIQKHGWGMVISLSGLQRGLMNSIRLYSDCSKVKALQIVSCNWMTTWIRKIWKWSL